MVITPKAGTIMPKTIAKNLRGIFAKNSRVKTMGGKTSVEPRSGCRKINTIGNVVATSTFESVLRDSRNVPILERANMLAQRISVPIFAASVG